MVRDMKIGSLWDRGCVDGSPTINVDAVDNTENVGHGMAPQNLYFILNSFDFKSL